MSDLNSQVEEISKELAALKNELEDLRREAPRDRLCIGVLSGSLDRIIATFIIALGAAAYDMEVNLFFSFWSVAALRDPKKKVKKNILGRMFGWMLPTGSRKLALSSMNMGGMGPKMIRGLMRKHGTPSLEEMIKQAGDLGIKIHVCEMSVNLMGFKPEEMIDYPNLEFVGVGTFISLIKEGRVAFFM